MEFYFQSNKIFLTRSVYIPYKKLLAGSYATRYFRYYMLHCFIPSMMCVIASWLSFWLKIDQTPARITLGIGTFFTISQQTQTFNQGLPKGTGVKSRFYIS